MPLYRYICVKCEIDINKRFSVERSKELVNCDQCGTVLSRNPAPPSSRVTEFIDNGIVTKRVELVKDIGEIMKKRSKEHQRKDK